MSDSQGCESELIKIAEALEAQAAELRQAAEVLRLLRDEHYVKATNERIASAKLWAKNWMGR